MLKIQILGPGCARCKQLMENAEIAARDLGVEYEVEKVSDFREIARLGVLLTPGLVVNGQVKLSGRVAAPNEIRALLAGS